MADPGRPDGSRFAGVTDLIVVTGPPGAGKSTVARVVAGRFELSVIVSGDTFFTFVASGAIIPWLPESDAQNEVITLAAAAAAGQYASGGYTTLFDGVVGPKFLTRFMDATGLDSMHYVVLMPTVDECVRRVTTREGHGFRDEPATRKMYDEFVRGEIDDRHVLRDPPDTVEAVADAIVRIVERDHARYTPVVA